MLNSAKFSKKFRRGLWAECVRTACDLDNLDCGNRTNKPRNVKFYGKDYKGLQNLRKFGEIGVVIQSDKIKSKLVNRGISCLYLGNAENHSPEVARFMNTKRVIRSRDVKWLNKTFHEYQKSEGLYKEDEDQDSESDHDSDSEDENEDFDTTAETKETFHPAVSLLRTTRSGVQFAPVDESIPVRKEGSKNVDREMQRLSGFFNPEANTAVERSGTVEEPPNTPTLQQNSLEAAVEGINWERMRLMSQLIISLEIWASFVVIF